MEKNWIKEIIEFVRNAMNEGLSIYTYKREECYDIRVVRNNSLYETFDITVCKDDITIASPNGGFAKIEYKRSKRDELELDSIMLSIEEYKNDVALSEFSGFFNKEDKPRNIDSLDDDD